MKILVTGGTGFIGSHLVERLVQRNNEVVCLAKDKMYAGNFPGRQVATIIADLNNGNDWAKILDRVEVVYHLAGVTRARNTRDYYIGNVDCTRNFIQACARHGSRISRFVYVSSLTAAGPAPAGHVPDETDEPRPVSDYGKSKFLAEQVVLAGRNELPVTIVRPSAVYGPRDQDMYLYFQLISRGLHPVIGFRQKRLNLIHVRDLVEGILLAGEHPQAENEVFFLGSAEHYSNEQIGKAIADALQVKPLRIKIPHMLIYLIGAAAEMLGKFGSHPVFFNIQKAREAVQQAWDCSIEKAKRRLNFAPAISLEHGMQLTYAWYLQNKWL